MVQCLVTGGAGFVGSHLVEALVKQGCQVRVLDNLSSGTLTNLAAVASGIELLLGDLRNQTMLEQAVAGMDRVFHLAVAPFPSFEAADPLAYLPAYNLETLRLLTAARKANVQRVIFASSVKVYGRANGSAQVHEVDQVQPNTAYGHAKLAGEVHCLRFTYLHGLETVRLRMTDIFGPRQFSSSPYAQGLVAVVKAMLAGQQPVLEEPSSPYQDYLYIDDAVHALMLASEAPRASGQVYNVGRGRYIHQAQLVTLINEMMGSRIQPLSSREVRAAYWNKPMDISRAETELGFCPGIDLRQGLAFLLEYYARIAGLTLPEKLLPAPEKKPITMVKPQHPPTTKSQDPPLGD